MTIITRTLIPMPTGRPIRTSCEAVRELAMAGVFDQTNRNHRPFCFAGKGRWVAARMAQLLGSADEEEDCAQHGVDSYLVHEVEP